MFNNYGPYMYQSHKYSFSNIINSASRTLNVINQAIPIVKEVKPIFKNAKTVFNIMSKLNESKEEVKLTKESKNNTGPNFFI